MFGHASPIQCRIYLACRIHAHFSWKTAILQGLTIRGVKIGIQIRKARVRAKLTQEQLAFKSGLSRNYTSLLELDEKSPTIETLTRISKALGVRVSILIVAAESR